MAYTPDKLTTKGDLLVHNGTKEIRLAVGTNDYVLTADSAQTEGVKWAVSGGGAATSLEAIYISMMS